MRIEVRQFTSAPPMVLFVTETEEERAALDLLGEPGAHVVAKMQQADGMHELYLLTEPITPGTKWADSAFQKAGDREPIAVFRAQDALAEDTVRHWLAKACVAGVSVTKCRSLGEIADAMRAWPNKKLPD